MKVAVTGAAGFVGSALVEHLREHTDWDIVALSRSPRPAEPRVEWRAADLFSLVEIQEALRGADAAIYLVHSMLPSARLSQGSFADWDAILADNFARAAEAQGVKVVLYLGGILPAGKLSAHLASRKEVEEILGARQYALVCFRAGMVVGPGGSSFVLLVRLVQRLPFMLCPSWTRTPTQPVDLGDLVDAMTRALANRSHWNHIYDVGAPEATTYQGMMATVARQLGVRRWFVPVPFFSPGLSRLWVSLITGAPRALVAPLIKSLRHPMVVAEERRFSDPGWSPRSFEQSVQRALAQKKSVPRAFRGSGGEAESVVQSVQRLSLPEGWDAPRAAAAYLEWLPRYFGGLIWVERREQCCRFRVRGWSRSLLELQWEPERSQPDRQILSIRGGALARAGEQGFLEFRRTPCRRGLLAAIHRFRPSLPWYVYRFTQAVLHLWVMHAFGRYLKRQLNS